MHAPASRSSFVVRFAFLLSLFLFREVAASAQQGQSPEIKLMYRHAQDYLNAGDWQNAALVFGQLQPLAPDDPEVCYNLALCRYSLYQFEQAEQTLSEFDKKAARPEKWYTLLAEIRLKLDNPKMALAATRAGLAAFPDSGPLYALAGICNDACGKIQMAVKDWKKGAGCKNGPQRNLYELAKTYSAQGMYTDAILCGETILNYPVGDTAAVRSVKAIIFSGYRMLFEQAVSGATAKKNRPDPYCAYSAQAQSLLLALAPVVSDGITTENLSRLRIRFLMDWYGVKKMPESALFAYQNLMLRDGWFDVYNEWLFGETEDAANHSVWANFHHADCDSFSLWKQKHPLPYGHP